MRISSTHQVVVLLQDKRRIKLRCSRNDQLRGRTWSMKRCARAHSGHRLSRATVCTKDVVSRDTSAAKTAVNRLDLNRFAAKQRSGHSIAYASGHQFFEMSGQR